MRQVKGQNTSPELIVRGMLRKAGHTGYRLHRSDVDGNPDIAWLGRKQAIFVNGCFWHGHTCKRGARRPATNAAYWKNKIGRNRERDAQNRKLLRAKGWRVLVIWECDLADPARLNKKLKQFLLPKLG